MSDREDLIKRLRERAIIRRQIPDRIADLLDEAADALSVPCPYIVSSDEGTHYCRLAESK